MAAAGKGVACALGATLLFSSPTAAGHEERAAAPASPLVESPHMSVIREAPPFTLADVAGGELALSALRGRTVLLAFVYTSCTSACPLLTWRMARLQTKLEAARIPAVLLSVTVDPARDDAATLARYAERFGAREGWHFLRAEPARLAPVLAAWEEWTRPLPGGELDHPARLHLVDPAGRVREIYSLAFFDEEQAFLDIAALARERR